MLAQLRKNFPGTVTSDTVKRLGLAPKNESYVINAITFIGLLDEEGKKTENASRVFSISNNNTFNVEFGKLVMNAYHELFDLHGDSAWKLDEGELLDFFRQADQTSEAIGKRQVRTFKIFAGFAGQEELPDMSKKSAASVKKPAKAKAKTPTVKPSAVKLPTSQSPVSEKTNTDVAITVRVEVNLPPNGDQDTYDAIFSSIRKNLMDG